MAEKAPDAKASLPAQGGPPADSRLVSTEPKPMSDTEGTDTPPDCRSPTSAPRSDTSEARKGAQERPGNRLDAFSDSAMARLREVIAPRQDSAMASMSRSIEALQKSSLSQLQDAVAARQASSIASMMESVGALQQSPFSDHLLARYESPIASMMKSIEAIHESPLARLQEELAKYEAPMASMTKAFEAIQNSSLGARFPSFLPDLHFGKELAAAFEQPAMAQLRTTYEAVLCDSSLRRAMEGWSLPNSPLAQLQKGLASQFAFERSSPGKPSEIAKSTFAPRRETERPAPNPRGQNSSSRATVGAIVAVAPHVEPQTLPLVVPKDSLEQPLAPMAAVPIQGSPSASTSAPRIELRCSVCGRSTEHPWSLSYDGELLVLHARPFFCECLLELLEASQNGNGGGLEALDGEGSGDGMPRARGILYLVKWPEDE